MAKIDHTNCTHPRTPAGRRACRAAVASGTTLDMTPARSVEIDRQVVAFSNAFNAARRTTDMDEIRGAARNARANLANKERAAAKVRIQPRRSGARVSGAFASCVQAALHIDAHGGRCACGWAAQVAA